MVKIKNKFKLLVSSIFGYLFVSQPIIAQDDASEEADTKDKSNINATQVLGAAAIAAAIAQAVDDDDDDEVLTPSPAPTTAPTPAPTPAPTTAPPWAAPQSWAVPPWRTCA